MKLYFGVVVFFRRDGFNIRFDSRKVSMVDAVLGMPIIGKDLRFQVPFVQSITVLPYRSKTQILVSQQISRYTKEGFVVITKKYAQEYNENILLEEIKEWEPNEKYEKGFCIDISKGSKRQHFIDLLCFLFGKGIIDKRNTQLYVYLRSLPEIVTTKNIEYLSRCILQFITILDPNPVSQIVDTYFEEQTRDQIQYLVDFIELAYMRVSI